MPLQHDPRIDDLKPEFLRTFLLRAETFIDKLFEDRDLVPAMGALTIAACIWLASYDTIAFYTTVGPRVNYWLAFLFLLGVQYSRVKWPRRG